MFSKINMKVKLIKILVVLMRLRKSCGGAHLEKLMRGWRKLHSKELHNLYSLSNIIRVTKSRTMRWVGHVTCIGEMRNAYKILFAKSERKLLTVDERIILE
jgi:hypothetical protein